MGIFTRLKAIVKQARHEPPSEPPREPEEVFTQGIMDPLQKYINSNLYFFDRKRLTQTCSIFRNAFLPDLQKEELLRCVILGNQASAEALLKKSESHEENLALLLCGKVNHAVKKLSRLPAEELTAFQAALRAGHVAIHKDVPQMCEMFESYFEKIPNGLEEMHKQIEKIFPKGFPEDKNVDPPHVVRQKEKAQIFRDEILTPLINAIILTNEYQAYRMFEPNRDYSPLDPAFDTFRTEVKKINFYDPVFNPYYLLEAFKLYSERINHLDSTGKCALYCVKGIGFIQRFLPANDLLDFGRGIDKILQYSESFTRGSSDVYASNNLPKVSVYGLLEVLGSFKCCTAEGEIYWTNSWNSWNNWRERAEQTWLSYQKYCQQKTSALASLYRSEQQPAPMTALLK